MTAAAKKPKKQKPEPCGCFIQGPSSPLPEALFRPQEPEEPRAAVPLKGSLAARAAGCFMCGLILRDLEKNGRLTGAPVDFVGAPVFTRRGQLRHLVIEDIFRLSLDVVVLDIV